MHRYHNADNPGWTPPTLSSQQWESAYRDLKRLYDDLSLKYEALKLEKENLQASWPGENPADHGC